MRPHSDERRRVFDQLVAKALKLAFPASSEKRVQWLHRPFLCTDGKGQEMQDPERMDSVLDVVHLEEGENHNWEPKRGEYVRADANFARAIINQRGDAYSFELIGFPMEKTEFGIPYIYFDVDYLFPIWGMGLEMYYPCRYSEERKRAEVGVFVETVSAVIDGAVEVIIDVAGFLAMTHTANDAMRDELGILGNIVLF